MTALATHRVILLVLPRVTRNLQQLLYIDCTYRCQWEELLQSGPLQDDNSNIKSTLRPAKYNSLNLRIACGTIMLAVHKAGIRSMQKPKEVKSILISNSAPTYT